MKPVKQRFTLIEMLAVVAIASILIALITPAVQALLFGNRVDQYASNFKLAMEQAQSKAVAARKYVALVMPFDHANAANEMKKFCKGGYRMAYVKKDGTTFSFVNWVDNSEWKNPNDGAMLVSVEGNATDAEKAPEVPGETAFNELFKVQNLPADPVLGCKAEHEALIFSPYGGITGHDRPLYFTVTEAKYNSGYELPNPDNFLVLKLNSITGRVSYFDPYAEDKAEGE